MPQRAKPAASPAAVPVAPKGEPLSVVVRPPRLADAEDIWELMRHGVYYDTYLMGRLRQDA